MKAKYHVIECVDGNLKCLSFDTATQLNEWLNICRPYPHPDNAKHGECFLQYKDSEGNTYNCIIIKGHAKAIKQTVSVRLT